MVDHLSAYAALFGKEAKAAGAEVFERLFAWLVAVVCGLVFLVLAGIALMLGFLQNQFHWILIVVPLFALLLTAIAVTKAKKPLPAEYFPFIKEQLDNDAIALRSAG